jgi:hypothetical protein
MWRGIHSNNHPNLDGLEMGTLAEHGFALFAYIA